MLSYHRLQVSERFDLSGILKIDAGIKSRFNAEGDFLLLNDKSSVIYQGKIIGSEVVLSALIDLRTLGVKGDFDLEGIDQFDSSLYILNEAQESVIVLAGPEAKDVRVIQSKPSLSKIFPAYRLSSKFGLEGIAVNSKGILLAKEMMPLALFQLDSLGKAKIYERNQLGSQTDLKFQKDSLYILDREGRCVWKTALPLKQKEFCYSFAQALKHVELDYWARDSKDRHQPQWGTAEALELDGDAFIVGLDNNGQSLKTRTDTRPVIVFLKP